MRRMRIARPVAEGVVATMGGDPKQHGPLGGHGTENRQAGSYRRVSLKRAVRKMSVEPDLYPDDAEDITDAENRHFYRTDPAPPREHDRGENAGDGRDDCRPREAVLQPS